MTFDTDAVVAMFEEVGVIDDQHRLWRCEHLREMFAEVLLDCTVFPGALANESPDFVLVYVESFADTTQVLVTSRTDQSLDVSWSNTPRVRCFRPRGTIGTRDKRVPEGSKKPTDGDFRRTTPVRDSTHGLDRSRTEIATSSNRRSTGPQPFDNSQRMWSYDRTVTIEKPLITAP